jgi:hypothetical protein
MGLQAVQAPLKEGYREVAVLSPARSRGQPEPISRIVIYEGLPPLNARAVRKAAA